MTPGPEQYFLTYSDPSMASLIVNDEHLNRQLKKSKVLTMDMINSLKTM